MTSSRSESPRRRTAGRRSRQLLTIALLGGALWALTPAVRADVFSLWPFRKNSPENAAPGTGRSSAPAADGMNELLGGRAFWKEPMRINGQAMELEVELVNLPLAEALTVLKNRLPDATIAANSNSVLVEQALPSGVSKRLFLLAFPGLDSLVQFAMEVPPGVQARVPDWPRDLPEFSDAENRLVMQFPARKSTYAAFALPNTAREQALSELDRRLKSLGWVNVTKESGRVFDGTGEVYLRDKPATILLLGVATPRPEAGAVKVSIYTRPVEPAAAQPTRK